jgi:FPC/CPF motif-containing protein YcgG
MIHLAMFFLSFLVLFKRYFSHFILGFRSSRRIITMFEVEEHRNDRWVVIDDDVYCLASMVSHSGGLDIIGELAGTDITRIFREVHPTSDIHKQSLNRKYWIGKIDCNIAKEDSGYFLKEKSIHRAVPECSVRTLASSNEECAAVKEQFRQYVLSTSFPCLGAKTAFQRKTFCFGLYDILGTKQTAKLLWHHLIEFINHQSSLWANNHMFTTYVACFRTPKDINEEVFETLLWKQLHLLHTEDVENGMKWADNYSDNPIDPNFAFSIGGRAFFIVGLHPNSSRKARQFITPAITFNSSDQFTNLRRLKIMTDMRQVIRNADLHQNGSINPNLIPNDNNSSAFEFSGKLIQPSWTPDFKSLHQTTD